MLSCGCIACWCSCCCKERRRRVLHSQESDGFVWQHVSAHFPVIFFSRHHSASAHTPMDIQHSIDTSQEALTQAQNTLSYLKTASPQQHRDSASAQKLRILTYLRQLKTVPLQNPTSQTLHTSLANTQLRSQSTVLSQELCPDAISNQLAIQSTISNILNDLSDALETSISISNTSPPPFSTLSNDEQLTAILAKIDSLKSNSRKLSSYIKILINDYLFSKEFSYLFEDYEPESLKRRKQKFLKLLETLLNNNILNPNSTKPSWLSLSSMDDPLVRFLILNRIITVHPTIPNKIMLKDLSVDL